MRTALKFMLSLLAASIVMLLFRSLAMTIYAVSDNMTDATLQVGDRVVVNRWSYGLRVGDGRLFAHGRWLRQAVERGDLVAFNHPLDTLHRTKDRMVLMGRCQGRPGDTVSIGTRHAITIPGRNHPVAVDSLNIGLICLAYTIHEKRQACIADGKLMVDGHPTTCAHFSQDYFWIGPTSKLSASGSLLYGLVPESHIIGRAWLRLFSLSPRRAFPFNFRKNSTHLLE